MTGSVLLVGCGKMGGALLQGWLDRGFAAESVTVVQPPGEAAARAASLGVAVHGGPDALPPDIRPAVVVLAVKPQKMDEVAPAYRSLAGAETVFLSIAAGKTLGNLQDDLGDASAIVRSMPNTPAAVRRGIAVACANVQVRDDQRAACHDLLEAVGEVAWIDDERLMDAVTATSGSGPAYVFLLIECLAAAAVQAGLPADLAMRLARVTVAGSGELTQRDDTPAATLRRNVTSPGGTTEAALEVLMAEDGLQPLLTRAVAVATARSRALAS